MAVDPVFLILGLVGLLAAGFILSRVLGGAKPAAAADTAEKFVDEAPKPAKAPPPKPAKVAKALGDFSFFFFYRKIQMLTLFFLLSKKHPPSLQPHARI
jgi:hypothetical protein